jgi:PEP-CTERM/exosortase A-associated glycosyltransferase
MTMRILHILHRSLPGTHGYAIRSKYIVECQKKLSLDPIVITSPFQSGSNGAKGNPEYINDIPYYRTNVFKKMGSREVRSSSIWLSALRFPLLILFAKQVLNLANRIKPSIIHAHSPFYCGLVASWISKRLGIPSIYEVRGVWEGSSPSLNDVTAVQKMFRSLENRAIRSADGVVVISEHLEKELLSRGLNKNILVVPNGIDTTKFVCQEKSKQLVEKYQLNGKIVLGYIGTFSAEYEGLEYLIRALPLIIKKCPDTVLLLVGDGRLRDSLEVLAAGIGVKENVIFVGMIPHDLVSDYYSLMDICIFPRLRTVETELVTALKPLEAMGCGKAIIGSNVGGIQELISEGKTGILFEAGCTDDLARRCLTLIEDGRMREALGSQGKKWVVENRQWTMIVRRYIEIYNNLVKGLQ